MLTFTVALGYQGLDPIPRLLFFFFRFFFFSIQPTDQISGNAFDAKRKKRGLPYGPRRSRLMIFAACSTFPLSVYPLPLPLPFGSYFLAVSLRTILRKSEKLLS